MAGGGNTGIGLVIVNVFLRCTFNARVCTFLCADHKQKQSQWNTEKADLAQDGHVIDDTAVVWTEGGLIRSKTAHTTDG